MGIDLSNFFPEGTSEEEIKKYHEESKEDIFQVIRKTIGRHVPIDVRVNKNMEVVFFNFLSDEAHFDKDLDNIEKLDEILHYVTYYVPSIKEEYRVVVTLHG